MKNKPRFIIADQALRSVTGHFFEYDVSVAANVPEPYEPLIIGNSEARPDVLNHASAFFQCDFWKPTAARRPAISTGQNQAVRVPFGPNRLELAGDRLRQLARLRMAMRQMADRTHLLPMLQFARRRAKSGATALRSVLAGGVARQESAGSSEGRLNGGERGLKDIFLLDLIQLFETYAVTKQDVLFFPNMNHWTLVALAELRQYIPTERWPAMKLLFRRNIDTTPTGPLSSSESAYWAAVLCRSLSRLDDCLAAGRVELFTDTTRLQAEYAFVSSFPFTVLPIPFRHDYIEQKATLPETYQIAYFGEARIEKGFNHLPDLVQHFLAERQSGRVRFVFQAVPSPEPEVLDIIEQLRSQVGVTLLEKPLSDQEYYGLLNSSDVVLLLYDPRLYYSRSSCIFVESVVSATPFITFADTWMASVMEPGTGEIVESAGQIPTALRKILSEYARYQEAIINIGQDWRNYHNAGHLVELLLNSAVIGEPT